MIYGNQWKALRVDKTEKSKYKYVTRMVDRDGTIWFHMRIQKPLFQISAYYSNEREAALAVDKKLIQEGCSPVNILKRAS